MNSRLRNSLRNSFFGALSNIVITFLNFIVRTIFIKVLGNEYLGVNGLFTNILYILSFLELGVGHAITYCMYSPVATKDYEKVKSLLKLYKKYYYIIGTTILILGLLIIPFFPYIIKEKPNIDESIIIIYLLYLSESVISYFLIYKKSIIIVNQKDYLYDVIKLLLQVIKSLIQIIVLIKSKNYLLYLSVFIISTITTNLLIYLLANRMYPYIKDKNVNKLLPEEEKMITKNIKSLILYKIGRVSLSGTDNIIISSIIGLTTVGLYSNYSLIISAVSGIAYTILSGSISSIGNLNATEDIKKKEELMMEVLFISVWLYGFITICLGVLLTPFVEIWLGKSYLISNISVISAVFYILIDGIEFSSHTYISTLGYFNETKFSSLKSAIINIILSILLGNKYGLSGILIATSISKLLTTSWYDTYIIYKKEFKKSPKSYYLKQLFFLLIIVINYIICKVITIKLSNSSYVFFILKTIVTIIISNIVFFVAFYNTIECKSMLKRIRGYVWKN